MLDHDMKTRCRDSDTHNNQQNATLGCYYKKFCELLSKIETYFVAHSYSGLGDG